MKAILIRLDEDGTVKQVPNGYPSVREAIGGTLDFTGVTDKVGAYVDDEGLFKRLRMNIVASMVAGRPLYGPVVFGALDPDQDGDTVSPDPQTMAWVESIGKRWNMVTMGASYLGADPYPYANPDDLPPPMLFAVDEQGNITGIDDTPPEGSERDESGLPEEGWTGDDEP